MKNKYAYLEKQHKLFKEAPQQHIQVANGELLAAVQPLLDKGLLSKSQDGSYKYAQFFWECYDRCISTWMTSAGLLQREYPPNDFNIDGFVAMLAL
eukprot:COSAG01_NODE_1839_length_9079_cov_16.478731_1_plen_96_part_00